MQNSKHFENGYISSRRAFQYRIGLPNFDVLEVSIRLLHISCLLPPLSYSRLNFTTFMKFVFSKYLILKTSFHFNGSQPQGQYQKRGIMVDE